MIPTIQGEASLSFCHLHLDLRARWGKLEGVGDHLAHDEVEAVSAVCRGLDCLKEKVAFPPGVVSHLSSERPDNRPRLEGGS